MKNFINAVIILVFVASVSLTLSNASGTNIIPVPVDTENYGDGIAEVFASKVVPVPVDTENYGDGIEEVFVPDDGISEVFAPTDAEKAEIEQWKKGFVNQK